VLDLGTMVLLIVMLRGRQFNREGLGLDLGPLGLSHGRRLGHGSLGLHMINHHQLRRV
jgi:hypothetical protein